MQKRRLNDFVITVKMPEERVQVEKDASEKLFYEMQAEERPTRLKELPLLVFRKVPLEHLIYVRNQHEWANWLLRGFQETSASSEVNAGVDVVLQHFTRSDIHFLYSCYSYRNLPLFRAFLTLLKVMKDEDPEVNEKYPALDYEKPQAIFGDNPPRSFQNILLSSWTPGEGKETYIAEMFRIMTEGTPNRVAYFNGSSKI